VFETKSRRELAAGGGATTVTVAVVTAAMSDGYPLVDGVIAGATALVGFAFWLWVFRTAGASTS